MGNSVVERVAADLQREFPGVGGFSEGNIWRMRAFYQAYTEDVEILAQPAPELDGINLPQAVTEIPWFRNIVIIEKVIVTDFYIDLMICCGIPTINRASVSFCARPATRLLLNTPCAICESPLECRATRLREIFQSVSNHPCHR
jgi:hypothetical protein